MSEKQFYLLQVNDALFPIGGYSHSQGLETYIQRGIVHNVDTAREYITHKIKWNLAYTELLAARLAYEAAACAVYLHGAAADRAAAALGEYGMLPHDILSQLGRIFAENHR